MPQESRVVSGSISIETNAREYVAFHLMETVHTRGTDSPPRADQAYWLKLYRKCYLAVSGYDSDTILKG